MSYLKRALNTLLLGTALAVLPVTANAQVRRQPPAQTRMPAQQAQAQRAVPRQTMPRAIPNEWRRFSNGIRTNDRSFSFYYQSGIPFYMGIPGYIAGDIWFPRCYGPQALPMEVIVAQQWYNISRFGPTIGDMRTMRYNMAMGIPYGYSQQQVVENPVNEDLARENEELREQLRRHELEDAEKRGYERGKAEACCEEEPVKQQPQESIQTGKIRLPIEYGGGVAKVQYAGVAKDFYNFGLFEGLRKVTDGDTNLVAFIEGPYKLVVRDGNDGMSNLFHIDMSGYSNCTNVDDLFDKATSEILNGINIDQAKVYAAKASIDIVKSGYSACAAK